MPQRDPSPQRKRKARDEAVRRPGRGRDGAPGEAADAHEADHASSSDAPHDPGAADGAGRPDADERTAGFLVEEILTDLELASVRALVDEFGPDGDRVLVEALAAPPPEFLVERAALRLHAAFARRTFRDAAGQRRFLTALRRVAELQADLPLDGDADASPDAAQFDAFLDELGELVLAAHARRRARLSRGAVDAAAAGEAVSESDAAVDDPYWQVDELSVLRAAELGLRALSSFDAGDAETALLLAGLALVLDARAIDAQLAAALVLADSSSELVRRLERLCALAERALGEDFVAAHAGALGELLAARPFLRARQALGQALWDAGRRPSSLACDERTCELDPSDALGLRYDLLAHRLAAGDAEGARRVLQRHPDERGAVFAWGAVLERLLADDEPGARDALAAALRTNRRALPYLAGRRRLPRSVPLDYEIGDAREAALCADVLEPALAAHPAHRRWLLAQDAAAARDPKALARDDDEAPGGDPDRAPERARVRGAEADTSGATRVAPTTEEQARLFAAALALRDVAPWRFTDDRQLLGVFDAERGEVDHACVVGRHGGPGGLVLYRGALGFACHARVSQGALDPADLSLVQRALSVTFEERERLLPSDLNALARAGVRVRERGGWPLLRSWEPGLAPVEPDRAETRAFARALEQCALVLERGARDDLPDGLVDELGEHLRDELVRVPGADPDDAAAWTERRERWPALVPLPGDSAPELDAARVERLRASGTRLDDTWSLDALPTSAVDGPPGTRAPYVRIVVWVSEEGECALDLQLVPALGAGAALVEQALGLFEREGAWPRRLRVARPFVETALAPLAKALGTKLLRGDRLTLLDELCDATGGVLGVDGD